MCHWRTFLRYARPCSRTLTDPTPNRPLLATAQQPREIGGVTRTRATRPGNGAAASHRLVAPFADARRQTRWPEYIPVLTLDGNSAACYELSMIKSFKSPEAEKLFRREYVRTPPHDIQRTGLRKLWMIDAAPDLISLLVPPGNRMEALSGNRVGQQ